MNTKVGTCPVCNGSGRRSADDVRSEDKKYIYSYDEATDTLACNNCGGQTMEGRAKGVVNLRPDGTPCKHEYNYTKLGNCYHGYTCKHCGFEYRIDSGD